jgi:hypothetical protein
LQIGAVAARRSIDGWSEARIILLAHEGKTNQQIADQLHE